MRRTALLVYSRKRIFGEELFASVAEQLETSRKRNRGQWRYYRCSGTDRSRFHGAFGLQQSAVPVASDQDGDNADQKRCEDGDPDRLEHSFDPCRSGRPRL
jgi:hypothetical protein